MSNVVQFRPAKDERHASGEAFCLQCRHEWVAVAPTGTVQLQCPQCLTMKGLFKYPCNLEAGAMIRVCNCGNDLFYLTTEGHLCPNCGTYQSY